MIDESTRRPIAAPLLVSLAITVGALLIVSSQASGVSLESEGDCAALVDETSIERTLVDRIDRIAGPDIAALGGCTWHTFEPTCGPKSLGIAATDGLDATAGFRAVAAGDDATAVEGLGDAAVARTSVTEVGLGAQIEHLDVWHDGTWYQLSLLGRYGDRGQELLREIALEIVA
jgi:hypothetical protein